MNDCALEKLGVKPGSLTPAFNKEVTSYSITLASDAESITLDPRTSDNGASYEIKGGGDGSKTIPVEQGAKLTLTVHVTAEDGCTTRNYTISVHRLSAKDASLASLAVGSEGRLEPAFSPDQLNYECRVPYSTTNLKVEAKVSDLKIGLTFHADSITDGAVTLNLGATSVMVEVLSADGSAKRMYNLTVLRAACPRHIQLTDAADAAAYEDPISLSLLHQPVSLPASSDTAQLYSNQLLDCLFRPSRADPIDGSSLALDNHWQPRSDTSADARLSALPAEIVDLRGGANYRGAARELSAKLVPTTTTNTMSELRKNYQHCKPDAGASPDSARPWERRLRNIFDVSEAKQLIEMGEKCVQQYLDCLPEDPATSRSYLPGNSPQDHLLRACNAYACAIEATGNSSPTRWQLHLRLGQLLEEMQHCQDVSGVKVADSEADGGAASAGMDTAALDSAKEDEIDAICRLRGVSDGAGLGAKLRALDAEMRHLRDQGQSSKADSVQSLFLWKSRQATVEGAAQQRAASSESPLSRALDKYRDALSLSDSNGELHCNVGRLMVARGEYAEAVRRLESALSWQPNNPTARLYLGAALARQILQSGKDFEPPRAPEAVDLICDGLETLLHRLQTPAGATEAKRRLFAEEPLQPTDHALLRAALSLGQLTPQQQRGPLRAARLHQACLLTARALALLPPRCERRQLVRRLLIDCHAALLPTGNNPAGELLLARRCRSLSALIALTTSSTASSSADADLAALQRRVAETLVRSNPFWSPALCQLGTAQLARAEAATSPTEADERRRCLADAEASLRAAIELEGKPAEGDSAPELVRGQDWWQQADAEEAKAKAAQTTAAATSATSESPKTAAATAPTAAPRGGARGCARGGAAPAAARGGANRGGANRGGAASNRGGAATRGAARGGATTSTKVGGPAAPAATTATKSGATPEAPAATAEAPQPAPQPEAQAAPQAASPKKKPAAPINRPSAAARLALARTLRAAEKPDEALAMFEAVQRMSPDCHDAYIEAADMVLTGKQPLKAVDIYCRFPIADAANPSFDDAYIFGEIVRLLVKHEQFDDPRLPEYMIKWGRVMGLPILDKYIAVLQDKLKTGICKQVYAGVNGRSVDDAEMLAFFKARCWD